MKVVLRPPVHGFGAQCYMLYVYEKQEIGLVGGRCCSEVWGVILGAIAAFSWAQGAGTGITG